MSLTHLPDRVVIKKEWLPLALYQEAISIFTHYTAAGKWEEEAERMSMDTNYKPSGSFEFLYHYVYNTLLQGKPTTKVMLREVFVEYLESILYEMEPILQKEEQTGSLITTPIKIEDEQLTFDIVEEAIENDRIYTTMNSDFMFMRNTLSQGRRFMAQEDGTYISEIVDNKGELRGTAELRKDTIEMNNAEHAALWLQLVESTINAFDELTADLLDIISHMWVLQGKDEDGYIEFHSDEVLKLRHDSPDSKPLVIRERDRFKIMQRVAALSSIWISMRENGVKVVNKEKLSDDEEYDFTTFHRMFDIDGVKVAYDKKTGEPKGIYALKIRPAPILRRYFDSSLQTFVSLDLKVIQYSYHTQRELKRLGRYLSYQWKIRTLSRNLKQPFKVKTLLDTLDFPSSYNGVAMREKLEQILDDLQNDQIVAEWYYTEPVDESKVGKRDWVKKYWGELSLVILPPQETIEENKKKIGQIALLTQKQDVQRRVLEHYPEEIETVTDMQPKEKISSPKQPLSPETLSEIIDHKKLSIRGAASEMGISHNTLSRYLKNELKRHNKSSMEKMEAWYDQCTL